MKKIKDIMKKNNINDYVLYGDYQVDSVVVNARPVHLQQNIARFGVLYAVCKQV